MSKTQKALSIVAGTVIAMTVGGAHGEEAATIEQTYKDPKTGLEWMRCPLGFYRDQDYKFATCALKPGVEESQLQFSWPVTVSLVEKLKTGSYLGHNDWRIPTVAEFNSVYDCNSNVDRLMETNSQDSIKANGWRYASPPPIDSLGENYDYGKCQSHDFHQEIKAESYWTATPYSKKQGEVWTISGRGTGFKPASRYDNTVAKKDLNYVLLVRRGSADLNSQDLTQIVEADVRQIKQDIADAPAKQQAEIEAYAARKRAEEQANRQKEDQFAASKKAFQQRMKAGDRAYYGGDHRLEYVLIVAIKGDLVQIQRDVGTKVVRKDELSPPAGFK
jgi:Tfp pilus assembly protein PilP